MLLEWLDQSEEHLECALVFLLVGSLQQSLNSSDPRLWPIYEIISRSIGSSHRSKRKLISSIHNVLKYFSINWCAFWSLYFNLVLVKYKNFSVMKKIMVNVQHPSVFAKDREFKFEYQKFESVPCLWNYVRVHSFSVIKKSFHYCTQGKG